jgi:hypothetical protein
MSEAELLDSTRRPDVTLSVTRGASRLLLSLGLVPILEVPLANGRRADIVGIGPKGDLTIVEVKSCAQDYLSDQKWLDYLPYCDRYYFAVAQSFPLDLIPPEPGLIVADGFGGAVLREAVSSPLAGARRKALTLQLARLCAQRSLGWSSPNEELALPISVGESGDAC